MTVSMPSRADDSFLQERDLCKLAQAANKVSMPSRADDSFLLTLHLRLVLMQPFGVNALSG